VLVLPTTSHSHLGWCHPVKKGSVTEKSSSFVTMVEPTLLKPKLQISRSLHPEAPHRECGCCLERASHCRSRRGLLRFINQKGPSHRSNHAVREVTQGASHEICRELRPAWKMLHPQVRKSGQDIPPDALRWPRYSKHSQTLIRVPAIQGLAAFGSGVQVNQRSLLSLTR